MILNNDKEYSKACFEDVFMSHKWGNPKNSGVDYKRAYNKTRKQKKEQ